ncbi:outer membrane lipoprotein-sorting protein [Pseudoalteromonas ulvae]|uniref:Outer membrane lipoprotein-sorting protein n=1 Tax=Pseudoalteromonas ulvae TaxID=107327 RepID=A0A244CLB1_PSEDV|nr:outer membrane lipoprotein-sorting protein [Pseudoalteromonas ulvae]OUL56400.1 outer membrane lipoprotein-sorting protein [Pseudoalteromonas ulvae]
MNLFQLLLLSVVFYASGALANSDSEQGLVIATERKARDIGWTTSESTLQMVLRNAQGDESSRQLRIKSLEVHGEGDKGLTIFDQPLDVKGTAFLNHSHVDGADDQWLFLPALKRVKRIASQNKSGPFMGSEFAYEDLSSFELKKYHFRLLEEAVFDSHETYVIEQIPTDKYSGYSKQIVWLDKAEYRPLKVEYYDRKNSLLKTLILSQYQQYQGQYWRAHTLTMQNHLTKKSTTLQTEALRFDVDLNEHDFNQASLRRAR